MGEAVLAENNATTLQELRALPVAQIVWPDAPSESEYFNGYFAPDGYVLPQTPADLLAAATSRSGSSSSIINPTDMLIGTTSMDGTLTFVYESLPVPIVSWNYEQNMQVLYATASEKKKKKKKKKTLLPQLNDSNLRTMN